jgi:hypothetical protein
MPHSHILREVPLRLASRTDVIDAVLQVALPADEQQATELQVRAILPKKASAGFTKGAILHLVD